MISKRVIKIIAIIVIVTFIGTMIFAGIAPMFFNNAYLASAATTADLQKQLEESEKEREKIKEKRKAAETEKNEALEEKKDLDEDISFIEEDIDKIEGFISDLDKNIKEKNKEIDLITEDIELKLEVYEARIKFLYEYGSSSYISILFESKGFSDFLTRLQIVSSIIENDKNILEGLREDRQKIEDAKAVIVEEQESQIAAKGILDEKKGELDTKRKEQIKEIEKINSEIEKLKKAEEEEEKAINKAMNELASMQKSTGTSGAKYTGGKLLWPTTYSYTITSPFGNRLHPTLKVYKLHTGIDIRAAQGTDVLAAADGKVIVSKYNTAYGNYIVIDHGSGICTLYAHNSKLLVSVGDSVKRGGVIAKVGSTGYSTGPHIHFEVIVNGTQVDPMGYLK